MEVLENVSVVFLCNSCFFFFKQKTAYERRISDWSSDVCSSDLKAFISVRDPDKTRVLSVARELLRRGFTLVATSGTAVFLREHGLECAQINKVVEGRPHIVDLIKNGEISYIVNTTEGKQAIADSFSIRREALQHRVTYSTTVAGARALVHSLDYRGEGGEIGRAHV